MLEGDEWKTGQAAPTPADMIKYATTNARLLIDRPWYGISEVMIHGTAASGEVFSYSLGGLASFLMSGTSFQWARTSEIRVLAILPPYGGLEPKEKNEQQRKGKARRKRV